FIRSFLLLFEVAMGFNLLSIFSRSDLPTEWCKAGDDPLKLEKTLKRTGLLSEEIKRGDPKKIQEIAKTILTAITPKSVNALAEGIAKQSIGKQFLGFSDKNNAYNKFADLIVAFQSSNVSSPEIEACKKLLGKVVKDAWFKHGFSRFVTSSLSKLP